MKLVDGNNFIAHHLKNNISCAIGKIGITELNLIHCYMSNHYPDNIITDATNIAGIYPYTKERFDEFIKEYLIDIKELDAMPIWNRVIPQLEQKLCVDNSAYPIRLQDIEPQFHEKPWSHKLQGKKVLVVSPFASSIEKQFKQKEKIWPNGLLPDFNLITLKYPHARTTDPNSQYSSTKEAIKDYKDKMSDIDFDVALVGTGGASIPLTIHAKRQGKIGIHVGGALQILFGIRGARWDNIQEFHRFFNEHWVRPSGDEVPPNKELTEGGCYW